MTGFKGKCFIIMPFKPELNYFYLYLKAYIEQNYNLLCERADAQIQPLEVIDKIRAYIEDADIVIADCSGQNPNVFYELGIADTLKKHTVLITSDDFKTAPLPLDVRTREFIPYKLEDNVAFLSKLDNAFNNILSVRYQVWHERAVKIFNAFKGATGASSKIADQDVFIRRIQDAERLGDLPSPDVYNRALAEFLLPRIITDTSDVGLMYQITNWLGTLGS